MKRVLLLSLALTLSAQAALAQSTVLPIGKNATNQYSPSNPGCMELDIGGLTYSAANPIPAQLSQAGVAVGTTSPLAVQIGNGTNQLSGLVPTASVMLPVMNGPSTLSTYRATTAFQTPVATPTDIVTIIGSASKTVKVQRVILHNTQTTAGINKIFLIKHSTADTGSTVVNPTIVPLDSANAAATAVVNQMTVANPTVGAVVGTVVTSMAQAPAPGATSGGGDVVLYDSKLTGQPICLRGVAQELALNFAGAAVPTGWTVSCDIEFTEE